MPNEKIQAMVDSAFSDNPSEMKAAFYDAINDKVFDALQQRKQEMAKNFITQYNNEEETEETIEKEEDQKEQDETAEQ